MLVDDDPTIREIYGDALRERGHIVTTAGNHDSAAVLLSQPNPPDLLITDIDLGPGKSGLELAKLAQTRFANLAVLLISGHHTEHTKNPLLAKPFRLIDLLAAIDSILRSWRGRGKGSKEGQGAALDPQRGVPL